MITFIDSGVLGILTNPYKFGEASDCEQWLYTLLSQGIYVCSSDICDFEVRRGLVLALQNKAKFNGIQNLDEIRDIIDFLPIDSVLLRKAARLWASARSQGIPTADNKSLDVDIIIAAHWHILKENFPGRYVVVATTNVKHLSRFTEAKVWKDIRF